MAVGAYKGIQKTRNTSRLALLLQAEQAVVDHLQKAAAAVAMLAALQEAEKPRVVERAAGKWRGSTLAGYLGGDDITSVENFRCTKAQFEIIVNGLAGSALELAEERTEFVACRGKRRTRKAREKKDPADMRFRVAACMYSLGQEGSIKVKADVASIGHATLRRWLHAFGDACMSHLKPTYMSGEPFPPDELAKVQAQFASRRGMWGPTLACDGSHVPFKPKSRGVYLDYRNYKGWTSILAVAFVDSYYRFWEMDVGFPGRAGDNTVLKRSAVMQAIAQDPEHYLGPGGLVLGDSGASDGDNVFLNPYHNPTSADKCWFNFCHSSTRFFVEQTFGIWKSRFRFLLCYMRGANHALTTKLIYASAILHNLLIVHSGDKVGMDVDTNQPCWSRFFEEFKAERCPSCVRTKKAHCPHMAEWRNGLAQAATARKKPSELREKWCADLWARATTDSAVTDLLLVMGQRAAQGFGNDQGQ